MKRLFLRLLLLAPIPALVVCVNFAGDPAHLFRSKLYCERIARLALDGKRVANLGNYDERLAQRFYVEHLVARPDALALGSSRSLQIGAELFPGRSFYNGSVSGASIEDLVGIYQLYVDRDLTPALLVLGLDPWLLNRRSEQERWFSLVDAYERALARLNCQKYAQLTLRRKLHLGLKRWAEAISPSYFQASLQWLFHRYITGAATGREFYVPRDGELVAEDVKRADGSYDYPPAVTERTESQVATIAERYAADEPIYSLGGFQELDPGLCAIFEHFVDDCLAHGVKVIFFLTPYHPIVAKEIANRATYARVAEAESYFRDFGRRRAIPVVGSYRPDDCGVTSGDFFDGMHLRREAVNRLISSQRLGATAAGH